MHGWRWYAARPCRLHTLALLRLQDHCCRTRFRRGAGSEGDQRRASSGTRVLTFLLLSCGGSWHERCAGNASHAVSLLEDGLQRFGLCMPAQVPVQHFCRRAHGLPRRVPQPEVSRCGIGGFVRWHLVCPDVRRAVAQFCRRDGVRAIGQFYRASPCTRRERKRWQVASRMSSQQEPLAQASRRGGTLSLDFQARCGVPVDAHVLSRFGVRSGTTKKRWRSDGEPSNIKHSLAECTAPQRGQGPAGSRTQARIPRPWD